MLEKLEDGITAIPTPTRRDVTDWVLQSIAGFRGTKICYNSWRHGEYSYFVSSSSSSGDEGNDDSTTACSKEINNHSEEHDSSSYSSSDSSSDSSSTSNGCEEQCLDASSYSDGSGDDGGHKPFESSRSFNVKNKEEEEEEDSSAASSTTSADNSNKKMVLGESLPQTIDFLRQLRQLQATAAWSGGFTGIKDNEDDDSSTTATRSDDEDCSDPNSFNNSEPLL